MDYEKAYKEALERAKKLKETCDSTAVIGWCEYIFNELRESEDEKIRGKLLQWLKLKLSNPKVGFVCEEMKQWIAWLEKQGKSNFEQSIQDGDNIVTNEDGTHFNVSQLERVSKKVTDAKETAKKFLKTAGIMDKNGELADEYRLEKQGEQKQNPYSGTSFEYNGHTFGMCARDNGVEILMDGELKAFVSSEKSFVYPIHPQPDLAPKNAMEAIKEEKVDNANKVEPKFKVGDWVVWKDKNYKVNYNSCGYELFDRNGLSTSWDYKTIEDNAHLWTIQDAKDGDVLQLGWVTAIFKEFIGNNNCKCYCSVCNGEFEIPSDDDYDNVYGCYDIHPATKEQRDLLFKRMKEAGYEWDAESKKLNKEEEVDNLHNYLYGEQNLAWSEEDEKAINDIMWIIEAYRKNGFNESHKQAANNAEKWLKSLKPQPQWKPSEEQIQALEYQVHSTYAGSWQYKASKELLEQLKKL